jgi:hypothetical protein
MLFQRGDCIMGAWPRNVVRPLTPDTEANVILFLKLKTKF